MLSSSSALASSYAAPCSEPASLSQVSKALNIVTRSFLPTKIFKVSKFVIPPASAFQSADGQMIIDRPMANPIYSPDGKHYYELHATDYDGCIKEHAVEFKNAFDGNSTGTLRRTNNRIKLNGTIFLETEVPERLEYHPLPVDRVIEFAFKTVDGQYLIVISDENKRSLSSLQFFIGRSDNFRSVAISSFDRLADGGSTFISTAEGTFCYSFPTDSATWKGEPLGPVTAQ